MDSPLSYHHTFSQENESIKFTYLISREASVTYSRLVADRVPRTLARVLQEVWRNGLLKAKNEETPYCNMQENTFLSDSGYPIRHIIKKNIIRR